MGDFLVDFRPPAIRQMASAASRLQFFDDMHVTLIEEPEFSLVLTSPDEPKLWGPFQSLDRGVMVGLCGRIALDQGQWKDAQQLAGEGGLACKFIHQCYERGGAEQVGALSGNYVVLLFDRRARQLLVVTDRWGLMPAFKHDAGQGVVFSSHPDTLADAVGEGRNWFTSLAEFILTGKVSFPFSYYQRIEALPVASITTVALEATGRGSGATARAALFQIPLRSPQPEAKIEELAEELVAGFRKSALKRTLPMLGRPAVALSGGLDSRTLLCATSQRQNLLTFCCYDEENAEFVPAQAVAREAGVEFLPLLRNFDYYADHAEGGVRISSGMGCIASNHFLGFRKELRSAGADNLLTGCYCDYVFKGLALNKRVSRLRLDEELGLFNHEHYAPHFQFDTLLAARVRERLDAAFPFAQGQLLSEAEILRVEQKRMFPLSYEHDNAQRTVPQRVLGWFVPVAENDLLDLYLKMSSTLKLNRSLFRRMAQLICGQRMSAIQDANTGARLDASQLGHAMHYYLKGIKRRFVQRKEAIATDGSWPNWPYYVTHSHKIKSLWHRPNGVASELFEQVLGKDRFFTKIGAYQGRNIWLFTQLLTLKLWLDQRV